MKSVSTRSLWLFVILGALVALVAGCTTVWPEPPKHVIMITGFEPFGKRTVNLSYEVATALQRLQSTIGPGVRIELCRLPVEYDRAAAVATLCFEHMNPKPEMVLSLGEGGCVMHVETAATNLDDTPKFADNAGVIRVKSPILSGEPRRLGLTMPVQDMFCKIRESGKGRVEVSISAGNYVCNNTAYRLARYFRALRVRYGFIHVPHSDCPAAVRGTDANAELVAGFLKQAIKAVAGTDIDPKPQPATLKEVKALLPGIPADDKNCYAEFLRTLAEKYPAEL